MKTEFRLEHAHERPSSFYLRIIGTVPKDAPYVSIGDDVMQLFIPDDQLERVAVNILKALKSNHLKQNP